MTHSYERPPRLGEVDAFDRLSLDFPGVPKRILATMVKSYLDRTESLGAAVEATRVRLADACAV